MPDYTDYAACINAATAIVLSGYGENDSLKAKTVAAANDLLQSAFASWTHPEAGESEPEYPESQDAPPKWAPPKWAPPTYAEVADGQ